MKPMDGLELSRALRTMEFGKKLYIIMLTASEHEESLVEAFESGIDDYVIKPVSLRVLNARIRAGHRIITLQQQLLLERQELEKSSYELVLSNRRLQQMANTDILTGLSNRRYAMTRIEQEWETARRYNRPLSVLMLDLDFFKSVNDTFGHHVGDQILVHTAAIIRENTRASDIPCRLGGEEFFVIATNTDQASALILAERIRSTIESHQLKGIELRRKVTISIGVAAKTENKSSWESLIQLADNALYEAKNSTRNAVRVASY
jgi:diguanylate cyclase (GGDEF)-like protein